MREFIKDLYNVYYRDEPDLESIEEFKYLMEHDGVNLAKYEYHVVGEFELYQLKLYCVYKMIYILNSIHTNNSDLFARIIQTNDKFMRSLRWNNSGIPLSMTDFMKDYSNVLRKGRMHFVKELQYDKNKGLMGLYSYIMNIKRRR